jgi:radical SAM-linked protein
MRVRIKYSREGSCRFLSHLDMVRLFLRALRRGRLPLAYSQGFHPQPRLAFAAPLPVGTAGLAEYLDVYLTAPVEAARLPEALNRQLPAGLTILEAREVPEQGESLMALVNSFSYRVDLPGTARETAAAALKRLQEAPEALVRRQTKKGPVQRDVKPFIAEIRLQEEPGTEPGPESGPESGPKPRLLPDPEAAPGAGWYLDRILATGPRGSVRPEEVLTALGIDAAAARITREGVYIARGEKKFTPIDVINGEV